ncbi:hypothetical protein RGQ29_013916 [Quercus rubra]|uniref:Uncharacterized protein n=1 Tax=Quercus rubra TaxID=3512 RepID=A0AAN7FQH5_QUERU|nr:hypothetical protein RGQ29_013916 [Quercus rubra]
MAASLHTKKIKDASPIICRILTTTTRRRKPTMSSNHSISYFKPKIRIKFPKLIAKIMQKRCRQCKDDHSKNKKKWAKEVGLVFSGVMGKKKSVDACSSNDRNEEVYGKTTINKEMLDSGNEEGKQKRNGKVKSSTQSRVANKLPTKKFLSFTSFFNKNRKNFIKGNINKENDSCSICDGVLIGKQGSSGHLIRVPSKILTTRKKLRVARSLRKKMNKQFEREENDELVLCKKRIPMGERCRPLGFSSTLQYDKDGILLPEVLELW